MVATAGKWVRKRRWFIVTSIFAFLSFGIWWNWPRGDARFVGKWAVSRTSQGKAIHTWEVYTNGSCWMESLSSGRFTYSPWSVQGKYLRLGYRWHTADGVFFQFQRFLQSRTGWHPWVVPSEEWEIGEVTQDSIVLWPRGATESYTLTRVPK
jgi:hypothetical protein